MKNLCQYHIIGIFGSSKTYVEEELPSVSYYDCEPGSSIKGSQDSSFSWTKKFRKESDDSSHGKVALSTRNVSESKKKMLNLRKQIFQAGRVENFLRKSFTLNKNERLLEAYECSLFTTAGPIQGRLFITSERMAFHSNKSLKLNTSKGEVAKVPYKVSIPLGKVKKTTPSENLNKPEEKYMQIVTIDDFEFWFTGFVNYQRSFESLHVAISEQQ
ncbi:GEM-like protein 4 [Carex rostrata]